jgi:hypothetical protein
VTADELIAAAASASRRGDYLAAARYYTRAIEKDRPGGDEAPAIWFARRRGLEEAVASAIRSHEYSHPPGCICDECVWMDSDPK